jgi:DNA polymerase III subunit beta
MRYIVNSAELLNVLQVLDRVILTKNVTPIQSCVLFDVSENVLNLRSTDKEITLLCSLSLVESSGDYKFAVNAKRILEILKTIPEQPLTFDVNTQSLQINLSYQNGYMTFQGESADDFPELKAIEGEATSFEVSTKALNIALGNAMVATSSEEGRKAMRGVFFDLTPEDFSVVASDGRKLALTKVACDKHDTTASFILPPKPIGIVRSVLDRFEGNVSVKATAEGNATFEMGNFSLFCRLIDEPYPNYRRVIPQNNDRIALVDRNSLVNALRRVIAIADKSTCLVKVQLEPDKLTLSAENNNYAQSAEEHIVCQYDDVPVKIGFQGSYLVDLVNRLSSEEVVLKLADPSRAALIVPTVQEENTDTLMLLMPLLITN